MAVPKKKTSHARTNQRRAHLAEVRRLIGHWGDSRGLNPKAAKLLRLEGVLGDLPAPRTTRQAIVVAGGRTTLAGCHGGLPSSGLVRTRTVEPRVREEGMLSDVA